MGTCEISSHIFRYTGQVALIKKEESRIKRKRKRYDNGYRLSTGI